MVSSMISTSLGGKSIGSVVFGMLGKQLAIEGFPWYFIYFLNNNCVNEQVGIIS